MKIIVFRNSFVDIGCYVLISKVEVFNNVWTKTQLALKYKAQNHLVVGLSAEMADADDSNCGL